MNLNTVVCQTCWDTMGWTLSLMTIGEAYAALSTMITRPLPRPTEVVLIATPAVSRVTASIL